MSLAKKILSAFIEVDEENEAEKKEPTNSNDVQNRITAASTGYTGSSNEKFKQYFSTLFQEANLPGPDYFEFTKMVEAMKAVPDEQQRFNGAFAGLSIQGLNKEKLISSANEYLKILDADSKNFNATIEAAINDKVHSKKTALDEKGKRIQDLTREISDLNNQMQLLNAEIKENEEKIKNSSGGYLTEMENFKSTIVADISKINKYI